VTGTLTATALRVEHVSKVYGGGHTAVCALTDATFAVGHGEFLALVGPSGSGKTTLLSVVGALLRPTEGTVHIGDTDITVLSQRQQTALRARHIGFVFQSFNLVPFLTAHQNLTVMATLAGAGRRDAARRAEDLLAELDLADRRNHLPEQLSGGERQRVAIGRALVNDPDLVLIDEPTASLDTQRGQQVVELLATQIKQRGKAGIMVTHDPRMAGYTDRTLSMLDGRLREPR
jgi:putative ABC transport system ATP-binding protein